MNRPDDSPFPDAGEENDEQAEAGSQAQDVADEARARSTALAEDRERGGRTHPAQIIPDDSPDLVERVAEMNRPGRLHNDPSPGAPPLDNGGKKLGHHRAGGKP